MTALKPPFAYFGAKTSIATEIADLLPPHEHYLEPFAGSLAVLLAKRPSRMETVNDLDGDLMNFWRVLRERPADLERACALTPHARAELQLSYEPAVEDLERARRTWVKLTQGRGGNPRQRTGWRFQYANAARSPMPHYLGRYAARIVPAAERLASVSLECKPAVDLIAAYGQHPSVLIFDDPPYLDSVRTHGGFGDMYNAEMRYDDSHAELAKALRACRASVVLSGYPSPLYGELYSDWHKTEIQAHAGNADSRSRTEVLWSNRPFSQGTLFDLEAS
jgi:DNA adenine methylase